MSGAIPIRRKITALAAAPLLGYSPEYTWRHPVDRAAQEVRPRLVR